MDDTFIGSYPNSSASSFTTRVYDRNVKLKIALMNTVANKEYTFQLEQGTTESEYILHEEQDINFPLVEGQNFYGGDYLADDGIHHKMKQETVTGTTATFEDAKENGAYLCNQKVAGNLVGQTITFDTSVTSAIVQYELEEESIDPYTPEQQAVWEQIKALRTYNPVTNISSNNTVPATANITYVKDINSIINDFETRLEALESEV